MKRFALITLCTLISSFLYGQDLIKMADGKIVEVQISEIREDAICYKLWGNLDGPDFIQSINKIDTITLQNGDTIICSTKVGAEKVNYVLPGNLVTHYRWNLSDLATRQTLSYKQLRTVLSREQYDSYMNALSIRKAARNFSLTGWLFIGGCGVFSVLSSGFSESTNGKLICDSATTICASVGVSCIATNIALRSIGKHKIRKIAGDYNYGSPTLQIGTTSNGVGLSFTF